jgi:hypothetical protein
VVLLVQVVVTLALGVEAVHPLLEMGLQERVIETVVQAQLHLFPVLP